MNISGHYTKLFYLLLFLIGSYGFLRLFFVWRPLENEENKSHINKELYEVVQWPDIQLLMDKPGFRENAYLVNDEKGMEAFGSSAYFVSLDWLKKNQ